jgi:folate-dependent phosphoribosylglycinamide formyltransferase PurN
LNDHWGYLPLLRGKSTIAYSVLLNIPATPTIHFIDQGIDSGAIVGYYPVDLSAAKSLKNMRQRIKQVMPERVITAIKRVAIADFMPIANIPAAGLTFYEIHPWLDQHIAARILSA